MHRIATERCKLKHTTGSVNSYNNSMYKENLLCMIWIQYTYQKYNKQNKTRASLVCETTL